MEQEPKGTTWTPGAYRSLLPMKAVQVSILNGERKRISGGSGYLREIRGAIYLYTCWHVVTGYGSPFNLQFTKPSEGRFLQFYMQDVEDLPGGSGKRIGGSREVELEMYGSDGLTPPWRQDEPPMPN